MNIAVKGDMSSLVMPAMQKNGFVKSITNKKDQVMIMLMDNKGNKMAMKQKLDAVNESVKNKDEQPKITRTGEFKEIEGYKCEHVIVETSDANSDLWITKDLGMSMVDVMGFMSGRNAAAYKKNFAASSDIIDGVSLETNVTQKKNQEKTKMVIHDIKKQAVDNSEFSTDGYQVMDMPAMPAFK